MIDHVELWVVIVLLAIGSFGLRFVFLGVVGNKQMPEWLLRHLRYTAVSVLPALVAPLVLWPAATGGEPDPARLGATFATLGVGILTRNIFAGIAAGAATLFGLMAFLG
ncbi:membrane protein [Oceanicola sp. 22II-s10i]|uniref:AzlD domain-containing protein n=1 Tax=Oceanicola sp. 22II-s10i TaxID=1317116 RepID=UPI000B52039C|nr:AzlD domain-containing protein [Oceanicola sp. 22II-s10i]OWU85429.1 membrane protein [Oceanicola sp. 22II-s10i]